ncbi:hypothetical protein ACLMJK_002026 [Lecanora helva]
MPRGVSGGVTQQVPDFISKTLLDKSFKEELATPSDSAHSVPDILAEEEIYTYREESPWIEGHCMCVAGLLPQHIRNLIMSKDIEAIAAALRSYQDALNNASVDDAVNLYTQDGICMPQHAQSFVGIDNVRKAYQGFFSMIKFNVKFDIQEIVPVAPDWAFARTNSAGTTDVKGRGIGNEANQELFILKKEASGEWKIARYCFSTTNPPPK